MRIGILVAALVSLTACTTLPTPTFTTDDGAIRGYDPVAYHTEGQPVKGERSLTATYNGIFHRLKISNCFAATLSVMRRNTAGFVPTP